MPAPFPHQYETTLVRTDLSRGRIEADHRPAIPCSPSPQLDGDATAWSCEQLLLSSLAMCLLTTFDAFAARDGITVYSYGSHVRTSVERTSRGLVFTKFTIEVELEVDDEIRVRKTLADAEQHCLIANALRVPVEVVAKIRTTDLRQAG